MLDVTTVNIRRTKSADAEALAPLTFPSYRHLLNLETNAKFPGRKAGRVIRPLAVVVEQDGRPLGLGLAATPDHSSTQTFRDFEAPEILSLSVVPSARNRGLGRRLVTELEAHLEQEGWRMMQTRYTADPAKDHPLDRILDHRGWSPYFLCNLVFRSKIESLLSLPISQRTMQMRQPKDVIAVPWAEVTPSHLEELQRWQQEEGWIPPDVGPETQDRVPFEETVSKGLMKDDRLVGWILGHRVSAKSFRMSYSFLYPPLARRGKVFRFWLQAIHEAADLGYKKWLWTVSAFEADMFRFVQERLAPHLPPGEVSESRQRSKSLSPVQAELLTRH